MNNFETHNAALINAQLTYRFHWHPGTTKVTTIPMLADGSIAYLPRLEQISTIETGALTYVPVKQDWRSDIDWQGMKTELEIRDAAHMIALSNAKAEA